MRPMINCKRPDIIKTPSIMLAEFDHELSKHEEFIKRMRSNIEKENLVQKEKFMQMKAKYDREGVEHIEDELELIEGDSPAPQGIRK